MTSTPLMAARNFLLFVDELVVVVLSSWKMLLVVLLVVVPLFFMGRQLKDVSRPAQDRLADVRV